MAINGSDVQKQIELTKKHIAELQSVAQGYGLGLQVKVEEQKSFSEVLRLHEGELSDSEQSLPVFFTGTLNGICDGSNINGMSMSIYTYESDEYRTDSIKDMVDTLERLGAFYKVKDHKKNSSVGHDPVSTGAVLSWCPLNNFSPADNLKKLLETLEQIGKENGQKSPKVEPMD
jgi:hypothetical protein